MARLFDDGSSQYLSNGSAILTDYPMSFSGWFYSDDDTISQGIVSICDSVSITRIGLLISSDDKVFTFYGSNPQGIKSTTSWSTNTWHHAAGTVTSATAAAAYLDGGGKDTTTANGGALSGLDATYIGANDQAADATIGQYMSGRIAEVGVWNVVSTDAEIVILALGYSPLLVRPQSLVAYWPLIGKTSPEIDIVGGFGMTLNNSPTATEHPPMLDRISSLTTSLTSIV